MGVKLTASKLMIRNGARMLDIDHPEKNLYAAMAKYYGTDECFDIVNGCL